MVTKQLKRKDASGKETILDFGADAANVDENDTRMFVTKTEKENIGKALTAAESAGKAVTDVSNKIGTAGDTGGSQTAGTMMGKLNKVIADLATHMGRWTAERAGYLDTIKTETAKNNTPSETGTLSQKLSRIIALCKEGGAVKSVQKGTCTPDILTGKTTDDTFTDYIIIKGEIAVNINTINPLKSVVLLQGTFPNYDGKQPGNYSNPVLYELTDSLLTIGAVGKKYSEEYSKLVPEGIPSVYASAIRSDYFNDHIKGVRWSIGNISWQVIEFY